MQEGVSVGSLWNEYGAKRERKNKDDVEKIVLVEVCIIISKKFLLQKDARLNN